MTMMSPESIVRVIRKARLDLANEKAAQVALAGYLQQAGGFEREYRLAPGDVIDFFRPADGCGIEMKLRAAKRDVWRQLERYAAHDAVSSLILVSNTAMGLPAESHGKPVYFASLGRAWL